jgi:uncharacterized protein (TIGR02145 family)
MKTTLTDNWACGDPILGRDLSKEYRTIEIDGSFGTQCWMAENVNEGVEISTSESQHNESPSVIEKYCQPNDNNPDCSIYGGFYQWGEAVQYANSATNDDFGYLLPTDHIQGVCPNGWLFPTAADWCELMHNLDPGVDCVDRTMSGTDASQKLREPHNNSHWYLDNTTDDGSNTSRFSARGGGWFISDVGTWWFFKTGELFWAQDQNYPQPPDPTLAFGWMLFNDDNRVSTAPGIVKTIGGQVRCILNCNPLPSPNPGTNIPHPSRIIWEWQSVPGATGYKWNYTNDFTSAQDCGLNTYYLQTSLTCNTSYTSYVWAYNYCTHSSASELTQTTEACPALCGTTAAMVVYDGGPYNTVLIGTQCWLQQNLNVGTWIWGDVDQSETNPPSILKYCYGNVALNCNTYGGLYQWGEAVQFFNGASDNTSWSSPPIDFVQGICPSGWHIPSLDEFTTLATYLGLGVAGGHMKEDTYNYWSPPNPADNQSGFTALGSGISTGNNNFASLMLTSYFWTSSEVMNTNIEASDPALFYQNTDFSLSAGNTKSHGNSVRCVRDDD